MPTKQDLVNFIESIPGATAWYGNDDLEKWANGIIYSAEYDKFWNWFQAGANNAIIGEVRAHVGWNPPQFKNTQVYGAIIDYERQHVEYLNQELVSLQESGGPDDNPLAIAAIEQDLSTAQKALIYYSNLEAAIPS